MGFDKREMIEQLKLEIEVIEKGDPRIVRTGVSEELPQSLSSLSPERDAHLREKMGAIELEGWRAGFGQKTD